MPTAEGVLWVMGGLDRESAAGDVAGEGTVGWVAVPKIS